MIGTFAHAGARSAVGQSTNPPFSREEQCQVASHWMALWQAGSRPDAKAVLEAYPQVDWDQSIVASLAYEEFCLRRSAGEDVDPGSFCRRFPDHRASVYRVLLVDDEIGSRVQTQLANDRFDNTRLTNQQLRLLVDPPSSPVWPVLGERLLDFRPRAELGRGSFARVYLAEQLGCGGRLVALKVTQDPSLEADAMAKLSHGNIVPVWWAGEDPKTGMNVLCMPYLGRATLCDVLDFVHREADACETPDLVQRVIRQRGGEPAEEISLPSVRQVRGGSYADTVVGLAVQLCDALEYLHGKSIYHQDVKPANVLLASDGRALLMDFNLSIVARERGWAYGGTLPYMSPEQLRYAVLGERKVQVDERSDLFSLGVVLYELLTGMFPFGPPGRQPNSQLAAEQLLGRQQVGPVPISDAGPRLDGELFKIVNRCLAIAPADRYQSAAELRSALLKYLSPLHRTQRKARRHPWFSASIATSLAALLLLGAGYLATRPPYAVRQCEAGVGAYKQGDYPTAVRLLNDAIESDPGLVQALFTRGRAYQKQGKFELAIEDYRQVETLSGDAKAIACRGYCFSRLKSYNVAILIYKDAIQRGFNAPEIWNNLGHAHASMNQSSEALAALNEAVVLQPRLATAYHSRAVVHLREASRDPAHVREGIADIETAIGLSKYYGELFELAARLNAMLIPTDPAARQRVIVFLEAAVKHGLDPQRAKASVAYAPLRNDPEFQRIMNLPHQAQSEFDAPKLLDPLGDE